MLDYTTYVRIVQNMYSRGDLDQIRAKKFNGTKIEKSNNTRSATTFTQCLQIFKFKNLKNVNFIIISMTVDESRYKTFD